MLIQILDIGPDRLPEYARVPSRFVVRSILQPDPPGGGLCGIPLHEVPVPAPWSKDYDSYGELPTDFPPPGPFDQAEWKKSLHGSGRQVVPVAPAGPKARRKP